MTPRIISPSEPRDIPQTTSRESAEDKLDRILMLMEGFERRDKLRTWMSSVHSLFALVPVIVFIFGSWYLYMHGEELMKTISEQAARSAAEYSQDSMSDFMEQFVPRR